MAAHAGALVQIRGLSKYYGTTPVLLPFDLDICARERVVVIGPSGSGKTTLLRILIGLERPNSGTVTICGERLWHRTHGGAAREKDIRRARRHVGIVFQQFNLFPHMTAMQNVMEGLVYGQGKSKDEAREVARTLLERVGLTEFLGARPGQLSGGQQQRVAIARALALGPELMLFDEVTSALDPELVGEVLRVIRELAATTDMAMVIVTHEMRFAESIADRVLVFDEGRIVEEGTAREIFHFPKSDRTQRFLKAIHEGD